MPPITLAVVPSVTPGGRAVLDPLCDELARRLGQEVEPFQPATYDQLIGALERDRVDFAWMPPMLLTLADEQVRVRPLLSAVRGERTDYRAVLFADAAGPLHDVAHLQGTTVAWVDATSASGYFYPRLHLAALGVDPERLFAAELFERSHGGVVRAVVEGRAQVGATFAEMPPPGEPITRAGFVDVAPGRPMRVLVWTRPIPSDVLAARGTVDKELQRAFCHAVLALTERDDGRRLLHGAFHAEQFVPTPRNALRPLWDLIALARGHGLMPHL